MKNEENSLDTTKRFKTSWNILSRNKKKKCKKKYAWKTENILE